MCKRVATEHLTSILFKKECILLACNEGNIQVRSLTPPIRFVIIQITAFNPVFGYDRSQCSKRPNPLKLTLVGISRFSGALVGPSRGSRHMTSVLVFTCRLVM